MSIGTFVALIVAALWVANREGWSAPLIPVVAIPYWALVTVVWRRWEPYMPALHGNYDRRT